MGWSITPAVTAFMTSVSGFAPSEVTQNAHSSANTARNVLPLGAPILAVCTSILTLLFRLTDSACSVSINPANSGFSFKKSNDIAEQDARLLSILRNARNDSPLTGDQMSGVVNACREIRCNQRERSGLAPAPAHDQRRVAARLVRRRGPPGMMS